MQYKKSTGETAVGWRGRGTILRVGDEIAGYAINRIKNDTNSKIAIIGRKMGPVETVANSLISEGKQIELFNSFHQNKNIFKIEGENKTWSDIELEFNNLKRQYGTIPNDVLENSLMYKANKAWAVKIRAQGYMIIDIGNPTNEVNESIFYNMEVQTIFN